MRNRLWLASERNYLLANVGRMTLVEIGKALGRSQWSVKQFLQRYGHCSSTEAKRAIWEPKLRHWHAQGIPDCDLAIVLDCKPDAVRRYRDKLGLKPNTVDGMRARYWRRLLELTEILEP